MLTALFVLFLEPKRVLPKENPSMLVVIPWLLSQEISTRNV